jgi:hypothetical protein
MSMMAVVVGMRTAGFEDGGKRGVKLAGVGGRNIARLLHQGIGIVEGCLIADQQTRDGGSVRDRDECGERRRSLQADPLDLLSVERQAAQGRIGILLASTRKRCTSRRTTGKMSSQ